MNALRRTGIIAAIAVILILLVVIFRSPRPNGPPFPELSEIASIDASFYERALEREVDFAVPPEHFKPIFDSLTPAQYDDNPAKWVVLGELKIQLKDGKPFQVFLYRTGDPPGAFSSGANHQSRTYYRGGDSEKLRAALNAALASANKASSNSP